MFAPCVIKHLSVKKWICIASSADVAAPTEPVVQVFIFLLSVWDDLYLTCKNGLFKFLPKDWSYTVDVPAGVSTVYDQQLGKNLKRPFLHVRYRASNTESRKMKTWTTGSVGAVTSDLDAMQVHYLSERCLITQGANNFMLMK